MSSTDFKNINIPGFTVIDKLGSGAMAKVYLVIQNALDRKVALKIMADNLLDDPEFSSRFLREAKIVAQLSHPHIVSVYDVGVFQGSHYLSMEYHPGGDLKSKIRKGIRLLNGFRIARQLALALGFAHKEGYIHRDVKPENILFDRNDNAILTDFGIARSGDSASDMTAVGTVMGTPKYMSPEQAQGIVVDGRSDLYSLGVMMFEMLSGHPPYDSDNAIAICHMHINKPIPTLPTLLKDFQSLIDKTMAKNPADRVPSGDDIVKMLDELAPLAAKLSDSIAADNDETLLRATKGVENTNIEPPIDDLTLRLVDDSVATQGMSSNAPDPKFSAAKQTFVESVDSTRQKLEPKKSHKLAYVALAIVAIVVTIVMNNTLITSLAQTLGSDEIPSKISSSAIATTVLKLSSENSLSERLKHKSDSINLTAEPQNNAADLSDRTENQPEEIVKAKNPMTGSVDMLDPVKSNLLMSVQIVAPKNQTLCTTETPFKDGIEPVNEGQALRAGDCFSIKIEQKSKVDLIVYSHSEDGTIYRLFPNSCNAMGLQGQKVNASMSVQLPLNSSQELTVIGLDDKAGTEWIYAVAVQDAMSRQEVLSKLSIVPDVCNDNGGNLGVDEVQKTLNEINRRHPNSMQWLSANFQHSVK